MHSGRVASRRLTRWSQLNNANVSRFDLRVYKQLTTVLDTPDKETKRADFILFD
ncbi:MAG: hypothetical protein HY675_14985 [Chloroflexi bacterium]|nr:hypothetical protein [Chloroflexota bacterium]